MSFKIGIASCSEKACPVCERRFKRGDRRVSLVSGAFKNNLRYSRYHYVCFIKQLLKDFPELKAEGEINKELIALEIEIGGQRVD